MRRLVLFVLLTPLVALAQEPTFTRVEADLPHNTIFDLLQDRRGFLWIATADGLARFDGRRTRTFLRRPGQRDAIASNTVQALAEDPDGSLWVGTSAGVCRLAHEARGEFTCVPPALDVLHLYAAEGTLWALTADSGIWRMEGGAFRQLGPVGETGWHQTTRVENGRLMQYVAPPDGFRVDRFAYDADAGTLVRVGEEAIPPDRVSFVTGAGVIAHLPTGWLRRRGDRGQKPGFSGFISSQPAEGGLWIGTRIGLFQWRGGVLQSVPLASGSVLGEAVLTLATDAEGALWVGTRSGLFVHDPAQARFTHLDPAEAGAATPVMTVETDARGTRWVGTIDGLLRQPTGGAPRRVPLASEDALVWDVHASGDAIWVGTDGGVCRLTFDGTVRQCVRDPLARRDGRTHVYAIEDDGTGGLWAAGAVLTRLAPDGRVLRTIAIEDVTRGGVPTALYRDRQGRLWVGGEDRGLWRIDALDAPLRRVAGLETATVWSIHEADDGALWLGTAGGLVRFEPDSGRTEPRATDLPGSTVYGVQADGSDLWLTTGRGLARYRPATAALRVFGRDDGVHNVEFNRRALHRDPAGRVWAGGMNGLTSFDPSTLGTEGPPPRAVVTQVRAEGAEGEAVFGPGDVPRFGPEVRTVSLDVSAPLPSGGQSLRYAYRLDGDAWTEIDGEPSVRFAGLSPGHYVFEARAARGDGAWGEPARLALSLAPPWYATLWIRVLAALALAGGLALAWRARVRTVRREERMRWRIASDLHDDIGSGLSSVALLTEHVRDRAALAESEARQLTSVAQASREMIDSLREIVWFVDPAHDRPGAFAARARETARSLVGPGVVLDVAVSSRIDRAPLAWRRDLFLVLKESLHNAVRHAPGTPVTVRLAESSREVELIVRDEGPGFDPAMVSAGTGLRSLRQRAEALGGTLAVESAPGQGTTVSLRAPPLP